MKSLPTWRRVIRYTRQFGVRASIPAAQLNARSGRVVSIRPRGIKSPVWIRAGTADVDTFDEVFLLRQYNLPFDDFSPEHILDLGANVGYASLYFATRWPQARILAVEPAASNVGLLKRNLQGWANITCLQAAVWPHPSRVQVANPEDEPNAFRMAESSSAQAETIPAYTVTQLIDRLGCQRLDLLKMDVEGAEAEIFRHGTEWLDRVNVLVVELHDRFVPGCAEALGLALHGRRFRQEIAGNNLAIDLRF
jgi:FkbM family methyltransferase